MPLFPIQFHHFAVIVHVQLFGNYHYYYVVVELFFLIHLKFPTYHRFGPFCLLFYMNSTGRKVIILRILRGVVWKIKICGVNNFKSFLFLK